MLLLAEPPLVRRSSIGAKVREGGQRPKYGEEFFRRGIYTEYARLVWRRYLAEDTNLKAIAKLDEQDALARTARPSKSVAMADVEVPAGRSSSSRTVPDDEES